jgi:hypothetical protein
MLASKQELVQALVAAFEDSQSPSDDRIFEPNTAYFFDIDQAIGDFAGKHWKQIPIAVLVKHKDNLPFFTPEAYHFYLPAFLIAAIEYPKQVDVLRDNVIYSLTPPVNNPGFEAVFSLRVSMFTRQQAQAVLNFFLNYTEIHSTEEWLFTQETAETVRHGITFWKKLA